MSTDGTPREEETPLGSTDSPARYSTDVRSDYVHPKSDGGHAVSWPVAYDDPELIEVLDELAPQSTALSGHIGQRIGRWLASQRFSRLRIHAAFAGSGQSELVMASNPAVERLTLSDSSAAAVARLQAKANQFHAGKIECLQLKFPVADAEVVPEAYEAVTSLGIGLLHLPDERTRRACLADFFRMLIPGGIVFIDNKRWTRDLREDVDPISVYPLAWMCGRDHPHRILAVSREYPTEGIQRFQLQLMEVGVRAEERNQKAVFKIVNRWSLDAYPVSSVALLRDINSVGFAGARIFDARAWPRVTVDSEQAPFHLLVARKPR